MTDEVVLCPFNKRHILTKSSLQRHILRCMKNYPNHVVCPYDAMHRYKDNIELRNHMLTCPSKLKNELCFTVFKDENKFNEVPIHDPNARKFNLAEENWDEEV